MSDIKPVLSTEQIEAAFDWIGASSSKTAFVIARAIEREVLAVTRDCRTCDKYAICKNTPDAIGIPYMNCTNQSHYSPTERVDRSLK